MWGLPEGYKPPEPQPQDNVKLAYVKIGVEQVMIGVDNKTMEGFKLGEWYSIKLPLQPIKYDSFVRWCRLMDV